tara:strand:- start:389 stop:655 length:267 start_codon:yes stop_codon:yes gene_type:complete
VLVLAAITILVIIYSEKSGKIKDIDNDLIPDIVEQKLEEIKAITKKTTGKVKTAVNKVKKESKDVVKVVKGNPKTPKGGSTNSSKKIK